jgi:3-phenylpropionate/trans-cinnamate dioxygenase ferredoxin subunit
MGRYAAATVDEIPPGGRKIVELQGRSIGIFNIGGEFFAIRSACPHAGGPLCLGVVTGFVTANTPGRYKYLRRGEIIRCPWHGWEFDIKTGQSWLDPSRLRVRKYPVTVEEITPDGATGGSGDLDLTKAGIIRGPYRAEVYPVTVDRATRLVIVEA